VNKHPYVAHDQALFTIRNYVQMIAVCVVLGLLIHVAGIFFFMRYYFGDCLVPSVQLVDGRYQARYLPDSPRIPLRAIWTYVHTLNFGNMVLKRKQEFVDPELRPFFRNQIRVERDVFVAGVHVITGGRAEKFKRVYLPYSFFAYVVFIPAYFIIFGLMSRNKRKVEFVRGTDLVPLHIMTRKLRLAVHKTQKKNPSFVPLKYGDLMIPDDVERAHTLVLGTTGVGKSVLINQILRQINSRRQTVLQKAVIYDVKGEFVAKHKEEGDQIFCPFDTRSLHWRFFNELRSYEDFDILATSLYQPPKESKDEYWYNAARDVFRMGLFRLKQLGRTSNRNITEFFSQPLETLKEFMLDLPLSEAGGLKHIDRSDSSQAASVVSILQERLNLFRYLNDLDGDFSFRDWVRNDEDRRNIFLMNVIESSQIFRPLLTYCIDIMIRETLTMPDSRSRHLFFVIDEFGSLGLIPSIFDFLTMARSKGGVLMVANQDLGSVTDLYGEHKQSTFFNNFNFTLCFRINDPKTSDFLSKAFGEREVLKKMESRQMSPNEFGDRLTLQTQDKTEKVILPTEFQTLPNFDAFFKISNYGISRMTVPHREKDFLPEIAPHFIKRDFHLEDLLADQNTVRSVLAQPKGKNIRFVDLSAGERLPVAGDEGGVPPFTFITGS